MQQKDDSFDPQPRLSLQGLKVLRAFLEAPSKEICGADIIRLTKLSSGTLYPILLRFERAGFLVSKWEREEPSELARPRRRLYRISPRGAGLARREISAMSPVALIPVWGGA